MLTPRILNSHAINFCLLNSRSIRNKSSVLKDFVVDKDIDLLALTEAWLRPGNIDCVEIGYLCPTGYDFIHIQHGNREVVMSACFSKKVWILNAKIVSGTLPSSRSNSWMFVSRAQR